MNNGVYIWNLQIYTNLHVLSRLKIARIFFVFNMNQRSKFNTGSCIEEVIEFTARESLHLTRLIDY